jgi:hypothetical protein
MIKFRVLLLTILFLKPLLSIGQVNSQSQTGSVSTEIQVPHQGINKLNITLFWSYIPGIKNGSVNYSEIKKTTDSLLLNYPNTTDWWEIVNKHLTAFLISRYPQIDSLASDIQVNWISGAGYDYGHRNPTRCLTARTSKGKLYEYFGFVTIPDMVIKLKNGQPIPTKIDVLYQYIEPISDQNYPDGLETERTYTSFISTSSETYTSFESLNKAAGEHLLAKFPELKRVEVSKEFSKKKAKYTTTISVDR